MKPTIVTPETVSTDAEHTLQTADPALIAAAATERWAAAADITQLRTLQIAAPQLPNAEAREVYETMCEAERSFAAPSLSISDYGEGTATSDNQLAVIGSGAILAEAQHATDPFRPKAGVREGADHGTAGLAAVLAQRNGVQAIIARGRQTSNANADPDHPLTRELGRQFRPDKHVGFLSLHGCFVGKITSPLDTSELHAIIGLGVDPSESSWQAAHELQEQAKETYGLRVVIGNQQPHLNYAKDPARGTAYFNDRFPYLDRDEAGKLKVAQLASFTEASTTAYMTRTARERSANPSFVSMQLEISRSLRLLPADAYQRGRKNEYMAVYLGYCLSVLAADIATGLRGHTAS